MARETLTAPNAAAFISLPCENFLRYIDWFSGEMIEIQLVTHW